LRMDTTLRVARGSSSQRCRASSRDADVRSSLASPEGCR
jgi:hypothetical protein